MRRAGDMAKVACRALRAALASLAVAAGAAAESDVAIRVEAFGALHAYRPGDVTALRVRLSSRLQQPVECLLQWDLENADRDVVSNARAVTLAPGQAVDRWLYGRTQPTPRAESMEDQVFTLRLFEMRDGIRVRELAQAAFRPSETTERSVPVGLTQGALAVLGEDRMGLETLEATLDGLRVPAMQELTRVASKGRVSELPDRWEGLSSLEAIVWRAGGPQELGAEQAKALRRWIERGGHLVVVLPDAGDPWGVRGGGREHALADLLPSRPARRVDGIRVSGLLPVLAKGRELRKADATTGATLFTPSQLDRGWVPLVQVPGDIRPADAQGLALVIQRTLGHGRVSMVGLDLESLHRSALSPDGLPQADVFWNRVLGRRADAPSEADYRAWQEAKRLLRQGDDESLFNAGAAGLVRSEIAPPGRATAGVLSVMVFFAAYWLVAIPGCWGFLRLRRKPRWAWPAFTAVALAAAPVAWLLGALVGGGAGGVRHLTVADWILPDPADPTAAAGPLRVNGWMSASLGGFGTSEITLGDEASRTDLLLDWSPPPDGAGSRFPDTARTDRAIERPSALACVSRATSTYLQAWWLGAQPASWKRVAWAEVQPETVALPGATPRVSIRGTLRHELPGPLRDVTIMHVTPWIYAPRVWSGGPPPRIEPSGLPPRPARIVQLSRPWDGGPLDLGAALYPPDPVSVAAVGDGSLVKETRSLYQVPLLADDASLRGRLERDPFGPRTMQASLGMLGLYQMLTPPEYVTSPASPRGGGPGTSLASPVARVQRMLGRELDLSAWFTRPCVIVTGFLDATPCPVPLRIDGGEPESTGTTLVRIVVPLGGPLQGEVRPLTGNAVP